MTGKLKLNVFRMQTVAIYTLLLLGVVSFTACDGNGPEPGPGPQPTTTTHKISIRDLADLAAKLASGEMRDLAVGNGAKDSVLVAMPKLAIGNAADMETMKQFNLFLTGNRNVRADWLNGGVCPGANGIILSLADWNAMGSTPLMASDQGWLFYPAAGDNITDFGPYAVAFRRWDSGDYNFTTAADLASIPEITARAKVGDNMKLSFHGLPLTAADVEQFRELAPYRANLTLVGMAYPNGKIVADTVTVSLLAPVAGVAPTGGLYVSGKDGAIELDKRLAADVYFLTDTATVGVPANSSRVPETALITGPVWAADMLGYANGPGTNIEYRVEPDATNTILGPDDAFFAGAATPAAPSNGALKFKQDPVVGSQMIWYRPVGEQYGPIDIRNMNPHTYSILERSGQVANKDSPEDYRINEVLHWYYNEVNFYLPQSIGNVDVKLSDFGQGTWDMESLSRFAFVMGKLLQQPDIIKTTVTVDRAGQKIVISLPRFMLEVVGTQGASPWDIDYNLGQLGPNKLGVVLNGFEKASPEEDVIKRLVRLFYVYRYPGLQQTSDIPKILSDEEAAKVLVPGGKPAQILTEHPGFIIGR